MQQPIPEHVSAALVAADRTCGWNFRRLAVRRFRLGTCELIVVPAQCWAFRRRIPADPNTAGNSGAKL